MIVTILRVQFVSFLVFPLGLFFAGTDLFVKRQRNACQQDTRHIAF